MSLRSVFVPRAREPKSMILVIECSFAKETISLNIRSGKLYFIFNIAPLSALIILNSIHKYNKPTLLFSYKNHKNTKSGKNLIFPLLVSLLFLFIVLSIHFSCFYSKDIKGYTTAKNNT